MKKEEMKAMRELLEYGEIKTLARQNGLSEDRASNLLNGRTTPKDSDTPFLMAVFDKVLPRKERYKKLKQIAS